MPSDRKEASFAEAVCLCVFRIFSADFKEGLEKMNKYRPTLFGVNK